METSLIKYMIANAYFHTLEGLKSFTTMDHCTSRRCLIDCIRLIIVLLICFLFSGPKPICFACLLLCSFLCQVDWKPESVEKFGDIEDLVKAVSSVKIDEAKVPGSSCLNLVMKFDVMPIYYYNGS